MKKAAEIREQNSTENEVEKARAMFDDAILLDDEPDDKSDDEPDDKQDDKPKKKPDLSYLDEIDLDDEEYEDEESDYVDGYNPDDYTDLDDLEDDDDFIIITDDDK